MIRFFHKIRLLVGLLLFVGIVAATGQLICGEKLFVIAKEILQKTEKKFGVNARHRLQDWQKLINLDTSENDLQRLDKVNDFFNQMEFVDDSIHWKKEDYWATPFEFLNTEAGDCEDYSISKYFTLKAMGIPDEKLNLTYVKAINLNQHHMVLTYYSKPGAVPLVLDNLVSIVRPATERPDLIPIYSFNGTSLWIAKQRGRGKMIGRSSQINRWQELLERMPAGIFD